MFALLFDRKSGLLTLLAVGAVGVLLFAAGLVVGASLSWQTLASHLPQQTMASTTAPAAPAPLPTGVARSRPLPSTSATSAEPAAFTRREPSASSAAPADWVPLTDGAPWPGAAGESTEPRARTRDVGHSAATAAEDFADEAPEKASSGVRYFVQAGTFSDEAGAEEMRISLRARCRGKHYQPFVESIWDRYGRRLVAVRIGPFPDETTAQEVSTGLNGSLVGRSSSHRT